MQSHQQQHALENVSHLTNEIQKHDSLFTSLLGYRHTNRECIDSASEFCNCDQKIGSKTLYHYGLKLSVSKSHELSVGIAVGQCEQNFTLRKQEANPNMPRTDKNHNSRA